MSLVLFREDLEKQAEGSPCFINQMTFNVKRLGTKESQSEIKDIRDKLYGPFPKPDEVNENLILANWLAYCGVTSWSGVSDDENDEEIEFSKQEARQLFTNERYFLSLNQVLINHAMNFERYLSDDAEAAVDEIKKL